MGKARENFDMFLFNIYGRKNCGLVHVLAVALLQWENEVSVSCFRERFKRKVVLPPKLDAMNG